MTELASQALWVALLASVWGATIGVAGALANRWDCAESARRAIVVTALALGLSLAGLLWATSPRGAGVDAPVGTALDHLAVVWMQEPSWLLLLAFGVALGALVVVRRRVPDDPERALAGGILGAIVLALLVLLMRSGGLATISGAEATMASPTSLAPLAAAVAYAVGAVPLAFFLAALVRAPHHDASALSARRWLAVAWLCLTAALASTLWSSFSENGATNGWALSALLQPLTILWVGAGAAVVWVRRHDRSGARTRAAVAVCAAGVLAVLVGSLSVLGRRESVARIHAGQSYSMHDTFGRSWRFVGQGVSVYERPSGQAVAAPLGVWVNGARRGLVTPELRDAVDPNGEARPVAVPGRFASSGVSLVVALDAVPGDDSVAVRLALYPLLGALWIGAVMLAVGGAALGWPDSAQ